MHVPTFARQWKVSIRTVKRDLEAFEDMGKRLEFVRTQEGLCLWTYQDGVESVFMEPHPLVVQQAWKHQDVLDVLRYVTTR